MLRYSDELIEEIKNNNDIVDVISQYVILKRSGRSFFGLCPFHKEKSPSFAVSPDKQIFHCFGCGAGGNVFHFVSKVEGVGFKESIEMLAEKANITLPILDGGDDKTSILKGKVYEVNRQAAQFYHENLYQASSKIAQEYVKKRKLDQQTLKNFLIGFSGHFDELYQHLKKQGFAEEEILASSLVNKTEKGRYMDRFRDRFMFPILDIRGRVIAFGGRVLDDTKPKYINSPETIVYSKGRHLFGLFNAKKAGGLEKIVIVEGYMDAISLHQRGITNVVASLGTALTEAQGRLLRKSAEKIIIGYDADGAGQAATLRGLEILQNLGCDLRILQIQGAKDPDEFVTKYGSARFEKVVEEAISLIEFKVRMLKTELNLENTSDKIKFLNEVARILSKVDNNMEKEIYIDKIAGEYQVSKEAIYSEIKKLTYPNHQGMKVLEKQTIRYNEPKKVDTNINEAVRKRENTVLWLLMSPEESVYEKMKAKIAIEDFQVEENRIILEKLYETYEKQGRVDDVVSLFEEEEIINHLTAIMADDFGITDIHKGLEDILHSYKKDRLINRRNEALRKLDDSNLTKEEMAHWEEELNEVIIQLARMK